MNALKKLAAGLGFLAAVSLIAALLAYPYWNSVSLTAYLTVNLMKLLNLM